MRDELRDGSNREQWVHEHDVRLPVDTRNWRNVVDEIEWELFIKRGIGRVPNIDHKQRITVRRCLHDGLSADIAACAWSVLNNEWSTKPLRKPLSEQAR